MKIRELLKWFDDALRPRHMQGQGHHPSADKTDALTTMHVQNPMGGLDPEGAPPNWVPSQQDDRPRH